MIKRAVVTGANGLVGRGLVRALLKRDIPTVAVDHVTTELNCPSLKADLRSPGALDEVLTPETVVFHLAAKTSIAGSVQSPRDDFAVNVAGTLETLESVRHAGASLVFSSSSAVFDPRSPLPHNETSPKRASSPYGAGKLACEGYCSVYHHCYGLDIRIVRMFNVYGPGMTRYAIYDFFHKIREADKEIEILGDGKQVRDYLYIDDAAEGFLAVATAGRSGEDYNLASGQPTSISDLAQAMCHQMNKPQLAVRTTGKAFPGDVAAWYADISKIKAIGFNPQVPLNQGLALTIDWLRGQTSS